MYLRKALDLPTLALMALISGYFTMVGAEVFGHMVVGATAFAAPPRSFAMFEGPFGFDSAPFWNTLPPLIAGLFLVTLPLNWKGPRRGLLLIAFAGFLAVGAVSALHIYPQFRELVYGGYADVVDPALQAEARQWTVMAWVRWGITLLFGLMLLAALRLPSRSERSEAKPRDRAPADSVEAREGRSAPR